MSFFASPADLLALVLHRDQDLIIMNKPAGLLVHPVASDSVALTDYLAWLQFDEAASPAPVHRLDRDTTGCLVLGRHKPARRRMEKFFRERRVEKVYWAVVDGQPPADAGLIEARIKKLQPGQRMEVDAEGLPAVTHYAVLERGEQQALVELRPQTGYMHQLRAHCRFLGCPIAGDVKYNDHATGPMLLHARELTTPQTVRELLSVKAPLPTHWPEVFQCPA